jgi:hypothetical protein
MMIATLGRELFFLGQKVATMAFLKIKKKNWQPKNVFPSFSSHQISKKKIDINVYIYNIFLKFGYTTNLANLL